MSKSARLNRKGIEDIVSLTPMQEGMLYHYLKAPQGDPYFEQLCLHITGDLDMRLFKQAWKFVVGINEVLRTIFRWQSVREPVQIILKNHDPEIRYFDIARGGGSGKQLEEVISRDRREKFDLEKVPFRVTLCKVDRGKHALLISHHHILYDGWSNGIILREFFLAYDKLSRKKTPLPTKKSKFRDFVHLARSRDIRCLKEYWQAYLEGFDTKTQLPFIGSKSAESRGKASRRIRLGRDLETEMGIFVQRRQITLADLFYCAWGVLLLKYNDGDDIVFGITVSGRDANIRGIEDIAGLFINTLPLRVKTDSADKIADLLSRINRFTREKTDYETTPLTVIKECSEIDNKEELFDSVVVVENYPLDLKSAPESGPLTVDDYSIHETTSFALAVGISLLEGIEIVFEYESGSWADETVERMAGHFNFLVTEIVRRPDKKISRIDILSPEEKRLILFEFNNTRLEYDRDKTVHGLFAAGAAILPDGVALIHKDEHVSYGTLEQRAARLARLLGAGGLGAELIAGLVVRRSIEMVTGMLGIMMSGGAYLPIDPDYPADRVEYMITDSRLKMLVKSGSYTLPFPVDVPLIELDEASVPVGDSQYPGNKNVLSDLACVIYTSGSTGKAKGVMLEHGSIVDYICSVTRMFDISNLDIVMQQFSISFDAAIEEIYPCLSNGGRLVILGKEEARDVDKLAEKIAAERITVIAVSPLMLNEINHMAENTLRSVRLVLVGGDVLKPDFFDNIIESKQVYNGYGPTEATVCVSYYPCSRHEAGNIPIGKPIANTRIYILGKQNSLLPLGVAGELCIGGNGVARGYLGRDELTGEKFVSHPFVQGERIYRTGDLARWLPDGNLEFLGRMDDQVKIRGYRVEPAEVETCLLTYGGIKDAVVTARQDKRGERYLCAYVVPESPGATGQADSPIPLDSLELRDYLSRQLPHYMVPSSFVTLAEIPLTANGKVDKRALPEPEYVRTEGAQAAPGDEVEERMLAIWSAVLGREKQAIGLDDHFFDLGGHSLRTISLSSQIHKEFDVKIDLADMFRILTVRRLSEYVREAAESRYLPIEPVEKREYYKLSSAQKRLFILQQMHAAQTAYNVSGAVELRGEIDDGRLHETFAALVRRHESLRTAVALIGEEPVQLIHEAVEFAVEDLYMASRAGERRRQSGRDRAGRRRLEDFVRPFDLSRPPLFRVGRVKLSGVKQILVLDVHHVVCDGVSIEILVKEFAEWYGGEKLPPLKLQYKEYAGWCSRRSGRAVISGQRDYWLREFSGEIPVLSLPTDYRRPVVQSFAGSTVDFEIGRQETRALWKVVSPSGATMFMGLLAVFNIFISRVSGQQDIVVGTPTAGRLHADLEPVVGMFVNTLALRNSPAGELTFREFLKEVRERTLAAYDNQEYPFEDLVESLGINVNRDTGRNPLFDVMFGLENMAVRDIVIPELQVQPLQLEVMGGTSKFDIGLTGREGMDGISFVLEYCTALYKRKTIENFVNCFKRILQAVVQNPGTRLADIEIIDPVQKRRILQDFNRTAAVYPDDRTLHDQFEQQVEKTPERVSVRFREKQSTFREWSERANQWARLLRLKGVGTGTIVGLAAGRSLEMMVGLMAILKGGGAYLPVDPGLPHRRVLYLLRDSGAALHLSSGHMETSLGEGFEIIDLRFEAPQAGGRENLEKTSGPGDPVYLIYTSGSTGNPRGVMIEHRSVVNRLNWMQRFYPIDKQDVILQKTPFTFDVSVWELYWGGICGAPLCLLEPGGEKRPEAIIGAVERHGITVMHFVPSLLRTFLDYIEGDSVSVRLASLRQVFSSAEALSSADVEAFNRQLADRNRTRLINLYGPTEATVDVTYFDCPPGENLEKIPIGKPIDNHRLYILDPWGQLQPVGSTGELCIAGVGLARGYLNRPELTEEMFRFASVVKEDRLYRTGDLGRWLPDGSIEFLGRQDHQVKIRGFRIELGEIESRLLKHPDVKEAAVLFKEDHVGGQYLCAYVVAAAEKTVSVPRLRAYLSDSMPGYMVPPHFVRMDRLPLNPNGKVDRKRLPEPELRIGGEYMAPGNELEEKVAVIWGRVLGLETDVIGIDADFFKLGGHSLQAIRMAAKIHQVLKVRLTLAEVFEAPTIRGLAEIIEKAGPELSAPIQPVSRREYYELSAAQKRLFVLHRLDLKNINYNIPQAVVVEKRLKRSKLEEAFGKLVARHESLRTSFHLVENRPVQKIHDSVDFKIEYHDLKAGGRGRDSERRAAGEFIRPFDLEQAPLLRAGVIEAAADRHILMVDMHHIIGDGLSQTILLADLTDAYRGRELPALRIQYKDFAAWQNRCKALKRLEKQEKYWRGEFPDEIPLLSLPVDHPVPAVRRFSGNTLFFEIGRAETRALNRLARDRDATLYMVLLAVFNILLSRLGGDGDIVVGTPVAGRRYGELDSIIGVFVNTLALRNYPEPGRTLAGFLGELRRKTLEAFDNQDYPFEDLVEKVVRERDVHRNPLFDVMFSWQNFVVQPGEIMKAELFGRVAPFAFEQRGSKFYLTLRGMEREEVLAFELEYNDQLFKEDTVRRFIDYFRHIVSAFPEAAESRLEEIEIGSVEEKRLVLYRFNDTAAAFPRDRTIHRLFEQQALKTPGRVVLVGPAMAAAEELSLTYDELNRRSGSLARRLAGRGIGPAAVVGIMGERWAWVVIGILGILKAGAAYLPVDPDYPPERIDYMLKNSRAEMMLTRRLWLDEHEDGPSIPESPYSTSIPAGSPVYVIYTSGTAGRPKGVLMEHRSVVNLVFGLAGIVYPDGSPGRVALVSPFVFDASVKQLFPCLLLGHTLILVDEDIRLDGWRLLAFYCTRQVTISDGTPAHLKMMAAAVSRLKGALPVEVFVLGGEALALALVERFVGFFGESRPRIVNVYGPTECCDVSSLYEVPDSRPGPAGGTWVPIGKPLNNAKAYVLGPGWKACPVGIPGELWIGGTGVGRGYINNPELTAHRFAANPLNRNERMYCSGDRVRWLPSGEMEFLGRLDRQVKIRGFRIEPEEVETHLLNMPSVEEAVVTVRRDIDGDPYLCAYIVAAVEPDPAELRSRLSRNIPLYMVPSCFIRLERLPVTASGKIDRRALPSPLMKQDEAGTVPLAAGARKLAGIWSEVLGIGEESITMEADFFQLGGHSLKATVLLALIHKEFHVDIPLVEIFKRPTLGGLADYIRSLDRSLFKPVDPVEKKDFYPPSSAQKRLFVLHKFEGSRTPYNLPVLMMMEGRLRRDAFEQAIHRLVERHESLRTSFSLIGGRMMQVIRDQVDFQIAYRDRPIPKAADPQPAGPGEDIVNHVIEEFVGPFDLGKAPLFRAALIRLAGEKELLFFDMHHIISDGVSMALLVKEFIELYEDRVLPVLRLQYKDFSEWQNRWFASGKIKKQAAYWLNRFSDKIPRLNMPTDFPRPEAQDFLGNSMKVELVKSVAERLRRFTQETGATLFMVFLAVFNILLARYTRQEDIVMGTPVAGRAHADFNSIIGVFVNTLAMRNRPAGEKTFAAFLGEVKMNALEAYENQDYPLEELVDRLGIPRDLGRNPLVDAWLVSENVDMPEFNIEGLHFGAVEFDTGITHSDLVLYIYDTGEGTCLVLEYATALFKRTTAREMLNRFIGILEQVLENPAMKLKHIEVSHELTPAESKFRGELRSDFGF